MTQSGLALLLVLGGCLSDETRRPGSADGPGFVPAANGWEARSAPTGLAASFAAAGAQFRGDDVAVFSIGGLGGPWAPGACVPSAPKPDGETHCAPRLERTRDGLIEWWANGEDSFEHGFDVPSGGDSLDIDVPFSGAVVEASANEVFVHVEGTRGYRYSGLVAWDAEGQLLDARMDVVSGTIVRIHVDTADAVWPVTVDPTLTPATWLTAYTAVTYFGTRVAIIGDVNADGYDDMAVGSSGSTVQVYNGSASGPIFATSVATGGGPFIGAGDLNGDGYDDLACMSSARTLSIHHGSATGVPATATTSFSLGATSTGRGYVWETGDTNGDGYDDLLVTQPDYDNVQTNEGRVSLFRGSATGLSTTASWTWESDISNSYAGRSGIGADLNGDGLADLAVGSPEYDSSYTDSGRVYVFYSTAGTFASTPDTTISGAASLDNLGYFLLRLPDIDGDGDDELAMSRDTPPAIDVQRGSPTGVPSTADLTTSGPDLAAVYGGLWYAGDLNDDGLGDVAIGSAYGSGVTLANGSVGLFFGTPTGFGSTPDLTLIGTTTLTSFGRYGAGGGDLDGDGADDFIASAYLAGRVLLTYGVPGGNLDTLNTFSDTWIGSAASAGLGGMVGPAGDVNADGFPDVVMAETGASDLFTYHGSSAGLDPTAVTTFSRSESYFGSIPPAPGDFDGDGYGDLLVSSYTYSNGSSAEGTAWVYEGGLLGTSSASSWQTELNVATAYFGSAVDAGDFDDDGYDDAVVGASRYEIGQADEGVVFLYEGSATGLATSASWYWDPDVTLMYAGGALAVDDLDGDGFDDLAIGVPRYTTTASRAGEVFLFDGSAAGLSATPSWTILGTQATGECGRDVEALGDTNGDGYPDLALMCGLYDDGETDEGRVEVYEGSALGPGATAAFAWSPDQASVGSSITLAGGDADGDGIADLAVGVPGYDAWTAAEGQVWLFFGATTGFDSANAETMSSGDESSSFGSSVALVDADNDGDDDLYIGIPSADSYSDTASGAVAMWDLGGARADTDGDGDRDSTDCDDTDPTVYTGAVESCDSVDNDCDGSVDEAGATGATTWYADADGDTYGDVSNATSACTAPTGYVADATDCDDGDNSVNTGAIEACNGADDDCDGAVDESGATGETTWYGDADGDSYGGAASTTSACTAPAGHVASATDCDDSNATVNPAADEACDGVDNDCDGATDESGGTTQPRWYADVDGDGYGLATTSTRACTSPVGYVSDPTDCDDGNAAVNAAAAESCNSVDDDCDGSIDEAGATGEIVWSRDADGDGHGSTTTSTSACTAPVGYVADATDCDDTSATVNSAATETCNGLDDNCDGLTDDASAAGQSTWYADTDADGYGSTSSATACDRPDGYVADATDCNDASAAINPSVAETCNGLDDDCDGLTDDASAAGQSTWYADNDADGYGSTTSATTCDRPDGYVADATDCDDTSATINPAATETCNGLDDNCDGLTDDASAAGQSTWYADTDGDGYGSTSSAIACDRPDGYVVDATDCDDTSAAVHPAATEVPGDAIDEDCDGAESCYLDADLDGARTAFLISSPDAACSAPGEALVTADVDCDDGDATANPAAAEVTGSGVDEDCDGAELCFVDADGDSYRPDDTSTLWSSDADCADLGEALASAPTGDCDDTSTAYNPGAAEVDCADPGDYNCDGATGYADDDADGYAACEECDDADADVFPGAGEIAGDGIDGDCDGVDTCYIDADEDGYRTAVTVMGTTVACDGAGEAVATAGEDCDDADASVHPDAVEAPGDELDADCDGGETCYVDADGDGYRDEAGTIGSSSDADCADPGEALASAATDCDDTNLAIHPAAVELAGDGIDADCDNVDLCYMDADNDGFRTADSVTGTTVACDGDGEAVATAGDDCDDTDASVNPDGVELTGDAIDSDCDTAELCYADADDDGYVDGSGATIDSVDTDCDDAYEALAADLTGDCDDTDPAYNPGAAEADCADPNDYNCDGSVGYADGDSDGYPACEECDDGDATVYPGALELAGDLVDQDCDTTETCYIDADDDGYRPDATSTIESSNLACDGTGEAVGTDPTDDCDDSDAAVNASATEIAGDELDQDCDGTELCYVDADADGYVADGGTTVVSADLFCDASGEALVDAAAGDCDDASSVYHPGADESDCADPADYNCDGSSGFADADEDGFAACEECDDAAGAVNPDADEVCNDVDDDCDGTIDQGASDASTWYVDADADGYTGIETTTDCDQPDGYVADATEADCDDADATTFPGGDDLPDDGIDQDCDGSDATGGDTDDTDDTDDTGDGDDGKDEGTDSCGCASTNDLGAAWSVALGLAALAARRRAAQRP